jgi:NAD(P)-dependent dehydrogenase (short-subunit alcohol dehydrogenase family)
MMNGITGKSLIVGGGATGIGAATAERLAAEGALVTIGDINRERAEGTAAAIRSNGGTAIAVHFDYADAASIRALVDTAAREHGGVDGLANVGADLSPDTLGRDHVLIDMDPAVWMRTFQVNLLGYALLSQAVLPHLLERAGGVIVNVSSGAAYGGDPGRPAYAASKAGVNALTRHIASNWGKQGVRCNGLAPGLVMGETQQAQNDEAMQEMAMAYVLSTRLGRPADLAATAAFLFSDDAEWINGQVWSISGGMQMRD